MRLLRVMVQEIPGDNRGFPLKVDAEHGTGANHMRIDVSSVKDIGQSSVQTGSKAVEVPECIWRQ